jgi:hypothetical protein
MLKFTGRGFVPGVPARDLTDAEVKQFGKKRLIASGAYKERIVPVREMKIVYKRPVTIEAEKEQSNDERD